MHKALPALLLLAATSAGAGVWSDQIQSGKPPHDYVLEKLAEHRVVILGEQHLAKCDPEFVESLAADLQRRGDLLAMEFFGSERQPDLDRLVTAERWDAPLANEIMRDAEWPFVQYRDILEAAWRANRAATDQPPLRVIALNPGENWRANGVDYDRFMAERLADALKPGQHVLVYCGMHHAFTRYYQPDHRDAKNNATDLMERFGNRLYRRFGDEVFVIALHKPDHKDGILPFGGALDCAAAANGKPVGFDVAGTPVGEITFPPESFYPYGRMPLRFGDYTDGYIWLEPIDVTQLADRIPLAEYAPADASNPERVKEWATARKGPKAPQFAKWREQCH